MTDAQNNEDLRRMCETLLKSQPYTEPTPNHLELNVWVRTAMDLARALLPRLNAEEAGPLKHKASAGNCEHNRAVDRQVAASDYPEMPEDIISTPAPVTITREEINDIRRRRYHESWEGSLIGLLRSKGVKVEGV